jgi:uncharacterized cupredoxin-like copper-binding protein
MRTLFLTCIAFIGLSTMSFAQETESTATAQSKSELVSSKESGNYLFVLPAGKTAEEINKNAKYYVHYFTVDFNENTSEAKIKMISNDEKSRHVVIRFLTASGVQHVIVDGKSMLTEDFFNNYMK